MRCATAASVKVHARSKQTQAMPREGTRLREAYDFFMAHKGEPVEYMPSPHDRAMVDLQDFYGLDIRRIRNGSSRVNRKSTYILAGEWFGRVYIDYIAERAATHDRIAS